MQNTISCSSLVNALVQEALFPWSNKPKETFSHFFYWSKYWQVIDDLLRRLKITFSNLFSIFLYILGVDALAWGKSGQPQPLFVLFSFFNNNILQKTVYFSGIWTRIVELQGEYADHLTTITASSSLLIPVIYFPTM